jgi:hypothetical protein
MSRLDLPGNLNALESYFADDESYDKDGDLSSSGREDGDDTGYDTDAQQDPSARAAKRQQLLQELAPIPDAGPLLEEPQAIKIFKSIDKEARSQDQLAQNRAEAKKHWDYVLTGSTFSILEKSEDLSTWRQLFPPGVDSNPQPIPNKVLDLRKKIIAQITVDPFLPDPKPDGADSDRNRGAADLTKAYLRRDAGPTGTNDQEMLLECLNINSTGASAFVWVWMSQTAGGWRPMQKLAHPRAEDANHPLSAPKLDDNGQPVIVNGTVITERTSDPKLRYVTEDGQFTEDPSSAARQWMPKACRRVLLPSQVRTFPRSAPAVSARKLTLYLWETLGEAKERFPILGTLSTKQLRDLCAWRPRRWKDLVPEALRPKGGDVAMASDGGVSDDTLFFWYHHYCRISDQYPDGAEIAVVGVGGGAGSSAKGAFLLRRDTLREDVEAQDGTTIPVLMDPPVAQFKALHDTASGDPFGLAPVSEFGGANEIYAHLYSSVIEAIDKGLHPNVFIPSTSPVSRMEYMRRDGTPIEIMVPEDKPYVEEAPQIPPFTPDMIERIETGMNSSAGTNQTSNGLDSSYSASGVAKDIAIRQAKVALAQYYQNTSAGMQQFWLYKTQIARARLTVPQEVQLVGTQSAFKHRWFVGGDLLGVRNIPPAAGSGTMMEPMEKLRLLGAMQQNEWIDKEQGAELARSTMTDDLGLPPDVHEERVDREIGLWLEGPTDDWLAVHDQNEQQKAQYQQQLQAATSQMVAVLTSQGVDPQSAQQQAAQAVPQQIPQPQPAPLWTPFESRKNNAEPGVARTRWRRLTHLVSTPDYLDQPPPWRALADAAYAEAFAAAGGQTVAQQQQMQQQNAQPQFSKFIADIQQKVLATAELLVTKETAGALGMLPPKGDGAAGADPALEAQAQAQMQQHELAASSADAQQARMFDAQEAAKDRAHQANENALDRNHKMLGDVFKGVLQQRAAQDKAKQQAAVAPPGAPAPAGPSGPSAALRAAPPGLPAIPPQ